jgi:phosphatidylserine/phosphatidylglycerophosphate/cardiolipin synthase-like enzyme
MRRPLAVLFICVLTQAALAEPRADVLFSPDGGCQKRIVEEIGKARKSILIQAYSFTNADIAKAILAAKKRGVDCEAVLDKCNRTDKYSAATFLQNQGIPVLIDAKHAIAHNKIILIDGQTIITGSYNFSRAAETENAENMLVLTGCPEVAKRYADNYAAHRAHAEPYEGPSAREASAKPEATRAPPAADAGSDPLVYVTRNGSKYHAAGCSQLRGGGTAVKLNEAKGRYGPCGVCGGGNK